MIKQLLWPSDDELTRLLYGSRQWREGLQWSLWVALCFVAAGAGPWWANLLLTFGFVFWVSVVMTMVFIRETRRFEWTDNAGIYLVPQPTLIGRMLIVNARAMAWFAPLAIPLPDFGFSGLGWKIRVAYGFVALFMSCRLVMRSHRLLWRLSRASCQWLTMVAVLASLFPVGILALEGYWSRQAADITDWASFSRFEFWVGLVLVVAGFLSMIVVIWQFLLFHTKGSRKPEGQRRRRLQPRVQGDFVRGLILATVPFACWYGVHNWQQKQARRFLYEGDVQAAIDIVAKAQWDLQPGIPYRADYYDLERLVALHRELMLRPVQLDHFSEQSLRWWQRHMRSRDRVFMLNHRNIWPLEQLNLVEELLVRQILLDPEDGEFSEYVVDSGLVSEDVVRSIRQKRADLLLESPS